MAAIQKRSLVDQVYDRLRNDIITLQFPLGSKINVNELQDTLGVSCTPIREAINRLQQEGLVSYENNVGARVLVLEERDVIEIQQLATTLHRAAAAAAIKNADCAELADLLRHRVEVFEQAESPDEQARAVSSIIEVYYLNCGNRRLDRSMLAIQGQQQLLRHLYALWGVDKESDLADFKRLAQSTAEGNIPEVMDVIALNAERLEQAVIAGLRAGNDPSSLCSD